MDYKSSNKNMILKKKQKPMAENKNTFDLCDHENYTNTMVSDMKGFERDIGENGCN